MVDAVQMQVVRMQWEAELVNVTLDIQVWQKIKSLHPFASFFCKFLPSTNADETLTLVSCSNVSFDYRNVMKLSSVSFVMFILGVL